MATKKRYKAFELRRHIWRVFDILKQIRIEQLVCVIPDLGYDTARKSLRTLVIHGYIARRETAGGAIFDRIAHDALLPPYCGNCSASFGVNFCDRGKEKERERERRSQGRLEREKARPESKYNRGKGVKHDAA